MTVPTTINVKEYTGDNSTTAFSFPYLFYADSHLKVYLDGVLKTITTHYTVTGAENPAGGTVTFLTAPGTGVDVVIQRVVPTTQETDLENFDGNPADVTEKQFDLLAMVDQQLTESIERSILAPLGTSLTSNAISGTITATNKVLLISTAGPVASALADLDTDLDVVLTNPADGDILRYDGANWVNIDGIPATLGAANTVLQVNAGGTANEYEKIKALNVDINAATDTVITASDEIWFADATDSNLVKKDTVQGILDLISGLSNGGAATNRYYHGFGYSGNTTGTQAVTANRHYATPFHIADTDTFTRIGMEITTGAAGLARLGIYTWVDGLPGTLILDCGTVDTTSIALVEATISQTLTPGTYAVTAVFNATPTVRNKSGQAVVTHFFGEVGNAGSSDAPGSLYNSFSFAALPASFGGSVTYVNVGSTSPISLWLRKV